MDYYRFASLNSFSEINHVVTKRQIEWSAEYSMAYHTGEEEAGTRDNRGELQRYFGETVHFISAMQVHGNEVHIVDKLRNRGWESLDSSLRVDAMITDIPNQALTILTADCVPILFYDPVRLAIGAAHAGWQGTRQNIAQKTVRTMMKEYGSEPEDIVAGIGPSIDSCCYEVSGDVAKHFCDYAGAVEEKGDDKYMLDLKSVNSQQLQEIGIKESNIEISNLCTSCDNNQFFSHRREKGCSGRFMSIITMNGDIIG